MQNKEMKIDLEQLLKEGKIIQIKPQGYSMYPLFVPGRDEAVISAGNVNTFKRGDVVLYRRMQGILVLHRIYRRTKDGFYMVGDNQTEIEGPIKPEQIKGKMIAFVRKGKHITERNPGYRFAAHTWLILRPFRPFISNVIHQIKIKIHKGKCE
jgi:hypothetical protein